MNAPLHRTTYRHHPRLALLWAREETSSEYGAASDWGRVHERLVELGRQRAGHEREVCHCLLEASPLALHTRVGYASLAEYADRILGLTPRETEERLRVGRALADLPLLDKALASGELCWSAVREITRVAIARTEQAWLAWARGRRSREIERAVAARRSGDQPNDRPDPSLVKHRLRFEVRAETMALFRDLQATVRADLGDADVDDDTLLYEIARRALGGPGDEGRASYQVAVVRCDACGQMSIDAGGESHTVDDVAAEMMACDRQELGTSPRVGAPRARATQSIPPATRRQVMRRDRGRCVVAGCENHRFLDVHHLDPRSEGGSHDPERLCVLCGAHHLAVHAGTLCIERAQGRFRFQHADGTPYGEPLQPPSIDVAQQVFSALTNMGFKQTHARALIDAVVRAGAPNDTAAFLRAALRAT